MLSDSNELVKTSDTKYQRRVGKWRKYTLMMKNPVLVPHLPETRVFSKENLWEMLEVYGKIIIKPSYGSFGKRVAKVTCSEDGPISFHQERRRRLFKSKEELYNYLLKSYLNGRLHIVQQYVPLARIDDSPFDFRVMVQRERGTYDWIVTGMAAKVAANGYFVTNVTEGVLLAKEAIEKSNLKLDKKSTIHKAINCISLAVARGIAFHYRKTLNVGLDIGVDSDGKVWIIEANLRPNLRIFKELKDQSILRKIRAYKRR